MKTVQQATEFAEASSLGSGSVMARKSANDEGESSAVQDRLTGVK